MQPKPAAPPNLLRLTGAGDAQPAWIALLTTEHYTLGRQRAVGPVVHRIDGAETLGVDRTGGIGPDRSRLRIFSGPCSPLKSEAA